MDKLIRNFIAKQNVIDSELHKIVKQSQEFNWQKHTWYSHHDQVTHSHEEKELDVCHGGDVPDLTGATFYAHQCSV